MKYENNLLILFTSFILLISNASANNVQNIQKPLLKTALAVYTQCFPYESIYDRNNGAMSRVIDSSIALDSKNIDKSDINLFKELLQVVYADSDEHDKLVSMGGLLNIIEEINAPEKTLKQLGEIDADIKRVMNLLYQNNIVCNDIDKNEQTVEEIRDTSIKNRVDLLKSEIPGCKDVTWQMYLSNDKETSTCKLEKNDKRYDDLAHKLHLNAVFSKLLLLNWSTKNIFIIR